MANGPIGGPHCTGQPKPFWQLSQRVLGEVGIRHQELPPFLTEKVSVVRFIKTI